MTEQEIQCALAKMSKKITDYQIYVDRKISEFTAAITKAFDDFKAEISAENAAFVENLELKLAETIAAQEEIIGGDSE